MFKRITCILACIAIVSLLTKASACDDAEGLLVDELEQLARASLECLEDKRSLSSTQPTERLFATKSVSLLDENGRIRNCRLKLATCSTFLSSESAKYERDCSSHSQDWHRLLLFLRNKTVSWNQILTDACKHFLYFFRQLSQIRQDDFLLNHYLKRFDISNDGTIDSKPKPFLTIKQIYQRARPGEQIGMLIAFGVQELAYDLAHDQLTRWAMVIENCLSSQAVDPGLKSDVCAVSVGNPLPEDTSKLETQGFNLEFIDKNSFYRGGDVVISLQAHNNIRLPLVSLDEFSFVGTNENKTLVVYMEGGLALGLQALDRHRFPYSNIKVSEMVRKMDSALQSQLYRARNKRGFKLARSKAETNHEYELVAEKELPYTWTADSFDNEYLRDTDLETEESKPKKKKRKKKKKKKAQKLAATEATASEVVQDDTDPAVTLVDTSLADESDPDAVLVSTGPTIEVTADVLGDPDDMMVLPDPDAPYDMDPTIERILDISGCVGD